MREILSKTFSMAFGFPQVFRGLQRPQISEHSPNSVLSSITQPISIDGARQDTSRPQNGRTLPEELEQENIKFPAKRIRLSSDESHQGQEPQEQPVFAEEPARFTPAGDASRDCLVLLVTDRLVDKLNDLFEQNRELRAFQGPLYHAKSNAARAERSLEAAKRSLEMGDCQGNAEQLQDSIEKQEQELLEACQRRDELEKEYRRIEAAIEGSRSYTQYVLETAMDEAKLSRPRKPLPTTLTGDNEDTEALEQPLEALRYGDGSATYEDDSAMDEELIRRAAFEDFNESLRELKEIQARFDDRQRFYEADLAEYQQGFNNGIHTVTRSEFDRRQIRYAQRLTGALIDAEAAHEEAKERALELGVIDSACGESSDLFYQDSGVPETQFPAYAASLEQRAFIEAWRVNIPENASEEDTEPVEIDDWDAMPVDLSDSISMIDYEINRKNIDRWQKSCGHWEVDKRQPERSEAEGLLPVSERNLGRRFSWS